MATIKRNLPFLRSSLAAGAALWLVVRGESGLRGSRRCRSRQHRRARQGAGRRAQRVISIGQSVVFNQEINTDGTGLVQILLLDGTTFTVGPNSRIVIDEFVYNPAAGEARVVASVTKGAFRFIGGQTSRKSGGATINTPVGTIGIRGAMVEGNVHRPAVPP